MTADAQLADYYARRAPEYDRIYGKPERQVDLRELRRSVAEFADDRRVLEVACGTGWWTEVLASSARAVTALDINPEVLLVAASRERAGHLPSPRRSCPIRWLCRDLWSDEPLGETFDAGFAAFWWSHVPRRRIPGFLTLFHQHLEPGAQVTLLDNRLVPGSSTPLSRTDSDGNTFQTRQLDDGSEREVLKNFPEPRELQAAVAPFADDVHVELLQYYWRLTYRVAGPARGDRNSSVSAS